MNLLNGLGKYTQKETMILLSLSVLYYKLGDYVKPQNYLYELKNKNTDTLEFFELMAKEYCEDMMKLKCLYSIILFQWMNFLLQLPEKIFVFKYSAVFRLGIKEIEKIKYDFS